MTDQPTLDIFGGKTKIVRFGYGRRWERDPVSGVWTTPGYKIVQRGRFWRLYGGSEPGFHGCRSLKDAMREAGEGKP